MLDFLYGLCYILPSHDIVAAKLTFFIPSKKFGNKNFVLTLMSQEISFLDSVM